MRGGSFAALLLVSTPAFSADSTTLRAERIAADALRRPAAEADAALESARRALAATVEFEPTDFVSAGRKGEVVEDSFQSARLAYRRHRAILYEALGMVLARRGERLPARRHLARALRLDPKPARALALARAQIALGQGRAALDAVLRAAADSLTVEAEEVAARAADLTGLPSLQAELDRCRLVATLGGRVHLREGPLEVPPGARLSTSPLFRLGDAGLTLVYAADTSCRSCTQDLDELSRGVPKDVRVVALPRGDDQDLELRQAIALYGRPWPLLLGRDVARHLALEPRSLLIVARGGWTVAVLNAPFGPDLAAAVRILQKSDVQEAVPRPAWNRRPVDRSAIPGPPGLLPDGIAPGEDEPFPPEFDAFVVALRAGRPTQALAALQALEVKGDGWLLPPEARIDRALCLARMGRRDEARRLLLRTGDSRFEEAIDRLLERVGAGR